MLSEPVLVTGATGYVGGRLIPQLLQAGYRVRALGRSLGKMQCRPWASHPNLELAQGDVLDLSSLQPAARGCWAAFYLVHSMIAAPDKYSEADRQGAQNMVQAAAEAGLNRIIYLGGLGQLEDPNLSAHLRSRYEVARILQSGPTPTTFLRAAMILGSGSASFEILRYLVDRLPVMTTPTWVRNPVQPIAISNVLNYLQGCLEHDEVLGQTFDIGGPDILSYQELFRIYAAEAGLRQRWIIPVPVLTPALSSLWIHLVTPVPSAIARPLAEGLRNPVICQENRIREIIPQKLLTCRETIRLALEKISMQQVDTCWTDAGAAIPPEWVYCGDVTYAGGTILECGYQLTIQATPAAAWQPIVRMGGKNGYYFADALWKLRGALDRLLGGIGFRGGRRHPTELYVGDALDFWRVLEVEPERRLMLLAEMKLPGEAILEFTLTPSGPDRVEIKELSRFLPRGLGGLIYWYAVYPLHQYVFKGMLKASAEKIGRPIVSGPQRFTPKLPQACRLPEKKL
ncbi:MAG: SDR family oxidoreductase [Deltaproteobacteria bacterium]|nr:SDR family oxidoreductase [Deltaproteobacteria bacterium]